MSTPASDRKTLVLRRALGDLLMLLPALEYWCNQRGGLKVEIGTDAHLRPLVDRQPFVNASHEFDEAKERLDDYDEVLMLEKLVDFLPIKYRKHRTELFANLLFSIWSGYDGQPHPFDLSAIKPRDYFGITEVEFDNARRLLKENGWDGHRKLVAVAPFSKSPVRHWGKELDLARLMPDVDFVMLHHIRMSVSDTHPNIVNLTNRLDVIGLAAVCALCDAGIVPDSGVMHVLGTVGTPTLALFGRIIPSANRVMYYPSVTPVESSCPFTTGYCYDLQFATCLNTTQYRECMNIIDIGDIARQLKDMIKV